MFFCAPIRVNLGSKPVSTATGLGKGVLASMCPHEHLRRLTGHSGGAGRVPPLREGTAEIGVAGEPSLSVEVPKLEQSPLKKRLLCSEGKLTSLLVALLDPLLEQRFHFLRSNRPPWPVQESVRQGVEYFDGCGESGGSLGVFTQRLHLGIRVAFRSPAHMTARRRRETSLE